ncbi:hypothetical protein ACEWY4_003189 [Coilia grayii]|uniref:Ig-like domain-containing protein n=1 Tax=Coilia grayii TaxID=363190 RepID=A0ABD1KQK7_9TELE
MMPTSLFILLTAVAYVQSALDLTQPSSMVFKTGDAMTISCKVSGYSVTDNSYATAWIRQPAGKTLEWIAHIWGGGDIYRADSLKSRFSISKDPSSSTVTLKGQNLQTGDSAVYYCARYYHCDTNQYKTCTKTPVPVQYVECHSLINSVSLKPASFPTHKYTNTSSTT